MAEDRLPTFKKPPVVETVLGVQFDPIKGFSNAHLGAFWSVLRNSEQAGDLASDGWGKVNDAPLIPVTHERFGTEHPWSAAALGLRLTQDPAARVQFRNSAGDAMIQVQNGRLHYNWIGKGAKDYHRYEYTRRRFDAVYHLFGLFVEREFGDALRANQWEVTYVNHIPEGTVWNKPCDWISLFSTLPGPWKEPSRVVLESCNATWHFEIPRQLGRLHVDFKDGIDPQGQKERIIRLTLTARGPVAGEGESVKTLEDGLDVGHRAIVLTFQEITSPQAHRYWELEA